ncbi:10243_t:CDS:2, partial [Dentiscutata heterogama]
DKISELNSFNHTLKQERDDLNSKKHELEAEVGCKDSKIISLETKVNKLEKVAEKLEQQISQLSHELNIIDRAKEDPDSAKSLLQETNTHLAEQVSKVSNRSIWVIQKAYQDIVPIKSMKIKSFTPSLINEPHSLTPPPLLPKPFVLIGDLSKYFCKHSISVLEIKNL